MEAEYMRKEFSKPMEAAWYQTAPKPKHWDWLPVKKGFALEIGAASGWLSYLLRKEGWGIVCSDIFDTFAHDLIGIQVFSKEQIPFDDGVFDLVVCSNVLHHGDLEKTAREIHRVLKAGGRFISFQEPAISVLEDEAAYIIKNCPEIAGTGIDEHRPTAWAYYKAFRYFDPVELRYCDGGKIPQQLWDNDVSGGLALMAVK